MAKSTSISVNVMSSLMTDEPTFFVFLFFFVGSGECEMYIYEISFLVTYILWCETLRKP